MLTLGCGVVVAVAVVSVIVFAVWPKRDE